MIRKSGGDAGCDALKLFSDPSKPFRQSATAYPIRFLEWDSRFFGSKMGAVDLTNISATSDREPRWETTVKNGYQQGFRFLFCQIDAAEQSFANCILRSGAKIGDMLVTFRQNPNPALTSLDTEGDLAIDEAGDTDLPAILEIAATSFGYSRFWQDPRFDREKARQLYCSWLEESYQKERVIIVKTGTTILGFISFTLDTPDKMAIIRLLATRPNVRGRGVGKGLVSRVIAMAGQAGLERIQVGTQINNYGAIRFYEKMGFYCHDVKYRFHLWLD